MRGTETGLWYCSDTCLGVFFDNDDRARYLAFLKHYAAKHGMEVWAWCLMTNHVHLVAVPRKEDSLERGVGRAHWRHARALNAAAHGWTGHLWANRFFSTALDDAHLWAAARYVETNPVRAGLVARAEHYFWSSARAHALGEPDALLAPTRPFPAPEIVGDWAAWLAEGVNAETLERLRHGTATGRPCGSAAFVERLGEELGRLLTPQKRGPKPARQTEDVNQLDLFA